MNFPIIELEKINEVFIKTSKITIEQQLELREEFKFKAKNFWFNPLYRSGQWSGDIYFYNIKTGLFPIGLLSYFISFCKKFNYNYKFNFDTSDLYCNISDNDIEQFYQHVLKSSIKIREYQDFAIKKALRNKRGIIEHPTACHKIGTKILLFNGTLKNVEDINVGDILMGPDNTERKVLRTFKGKDDLYEIIPQKGKSFVVNKNHVLYIKKFSSKKESDEDVYENITVSDFLLKSKHFKNKARLVTNSKELSFNNNIVNKTLLSPYFIGLYLGGGSCKSCAISTTRFIPDDIKIGSIDDRYEVLAGLIDSNGILNKNYYSITIKSKKLRDDIAFVARSLGFFVTEYETVIDNVKYYQCSIMGEINKIPVRVERKKYKKNKVRNKNFNLIGFKIKYVGYDNFYGFEVDKDHLYFTGDDFIIHHNSGKSLIIYALVRFILSVINKKVLIIVPNINLVEQLIKDFEDYGWSSCKSYISLIYGNSKYKDWNNSVICSTWQSIYKKDKQFFEDFGMVIVDETHSAKASSIKSILEKCVNAEYRIGLTGSLQDKNDKNELAEYFTIVGFLGPVIAKEYTKSLQEKGYLSDIVIANLLLKYSEKEIDLTKYNSFTYEQELEIIQSNKKRNKVLKWIIDNINKEYNVLILCHEIDDHLKKVEKYLNENIFDWKVHVIYGQVKTENREKIRQEMMTAGRNILLCSYGTTSQGFNLPRLHVIILFSSYRSKIKVLQSLGRGLRRHESKNKLILFDIVDDMTYKTFSDKTGKEILHKNYTYNHWLQRLKYYKDQGFNFINKKINLDSL